MYFRWRGGHCSAVPWLGHGLCTEGDGRALLELQRSDWTPVVLGGRAAGRPAIGLLSRIASRSRRRLETTRRVELEIHCEVEAGESCPPTVPRQLSRRWTHRPSVPASFILLSSQHRLGRHWHCWLGAVRLRLTWYVLDNYPSRLSDNSQSQLDPLPSDLPFRIISKTVGRGAYAS